MFYTRSFDSIAIGESFTLCCRRWTKLTESTARRGEGEVGVFDFKPECRVPALLSDSEQMTAGEKAERERQQYRNFDVVLD
jgi:hypothetical protein